MNVDALDVRFVEDIARAAKAAFEIVDASDYLSGDVVDAVLLITVAVGEELGYNSVSAYRLAFGAVSSVFLDDA